MFEIFLLCGGLGKPDQWPDQLRVAVPGDHLQHKIPRRRPGKGGGICWGLLDQEPHLPILPRNDFINGLLYLEHVSSFYLKTTF